MNESRENPKKERRIMRIINVLKSKMGEIEDIEKEIKSAPEFAEKRPEIVLEEIIVPPLSAIREREEKKVQKI